MSLLIRNKKELIILSQILRVIYIMKDGSDGSMSMILCRIIHETHDSLKVNRLDPSHIMGQLRCSYE